MSYQERVQRENELAEKEERKSRYLQPTEEEVKEFVLSGELIGKCKLCGFYGNVEDHKKCVS